jgi:hypothetical protein
VLTFCVRNIPDTIGFVRDLRGFTTTMKTRFMFALNVGQFTKLKQIIKQIELKTYIFIQITNIKVSSLNFTLNACARSGP